MALALSPARERALRALVVAAAVPLLAASWAFAESVARAGIATELTPPTALRYADTALYDIVDARVQDGDRLRLQVELGAVDASGGMPLGITQPIVELYLDTGEGGAGELLPGSGMRMPPGDGWNVAVRITGDGAWGWRADELGAVDLARPVALDALVSGRTITVLTPFASAPDARIYAISGVYDPFRPDGWRPVARAPSPWAFSSPEPSLPIVDVFPADPETRARALVTGTLPRRPTSGIDAATALWVSLMLVGLAVAALGLWWRRPAPAPPPPEWPQPPARDVDDELLIGEADVETLLERLAATVGAPDGAPVAVADAAPDAAPEGDAARPA
jgi:hypothetical protein